ncbi:MAG: DUF6677 family protein, partial [Planctomycetia bacterium]
MEPNALPRGEPHAAQDGAPPAAPPPAPTPLADALASDSWTVLGAGQVRVPAPPRRRWGLDVLLLGWLVPGLGQVVTGRKGAGLALLLTITLLFGIGWAASDFACVHPQRQRLEFFAHAAVGAPALLAAALDDGTPSHSAPRARDVGMLYTVVAGLLNVIAVCSALSDLAKQGQEARRKHGEAVQLALAVARLQALARRPLGDELLLAPPAAEPGAAAAAPSAPAAPAAPASAGAPPAPSASSSPSASS